MNPSRALLTCRLVLAVAVGATAASAADDAPAAQASPTPAPPAPAAAPPSMTASIPIRFFANVYLREDWTRLQDKADLLLDGNQVDGLLTRLRFGMEFRDTTQAVSGGIRVSAGEAPNPVAPFVRLGDGFRPVTFGLDQFYVDVRPFKNKERVRGVFGKMPQPFWRGDKGVVRAEMTWDDDISPVGATLNTLLVKKNDKDGKPVTTLDNVAGYFIVEWFRQARFSGLVGDTSLWADQLKLKVHRVTLGAAYYHWQNLNSGARTPSFVPGQSASLLPGQSAFLLRPGFQETNAIYDLGSGVYVFRKNEFDLPRNLVDDALVGLQGLANGKEFRTPPLMGIGKVGPPFLHDARVFLSKFTRDTYPAGTVYSNSEVTNAPLAIRSFDDALRAVIEMHDLPAPDDDKTPAGGGCPVPPGRRAGEIRYSGPDDICPPYTSAVSQRNRSESREVIRRFRSLSPGDQQAVIEFLKQI